MTLSQPTTSWTTLPEIKPSCILNHHDPRGFGDVLLLQAAITIIYFNNEYMTSAMQGGLSYR